MKIFKDKEGLFWMALKKDLTSVTGAIKATWKGMPQD
jgi:hypothetical protein